MKIKNTKFHSLQQNLASLEDSLKVKASTHLRTFFKFTNDILTCQFEQNRILGKPRNFQM